MLSTKAKATPRFLSVSRKISEFGEECLGASYFRYASSFKRTAISTLDDSKTSSKHLEKIGQV